MGGFLIIRKGYEPSFSKPGSAPALRVFQEKGLKESHRLQRPEFDLYLYQKLLNSKRQIVEFGDTDFVAGTGTLIYKQKSGSDALADRLAERAL